MKDQVWKTPFWPEGVPHTISDYKFPLFKLLDDSAKDYPDNVFTIFNGATRTYAEVKEAADKIANFLAGKGIGKDDKIAIFLPNLPQFPEILFGILKTGAVAVTCNPVYTASELQFQLKNSESKMVFCMDHPQFYPNTVKAIEGTNVETVVICNIKSYLPGFKALLGGLLGKIPKAERHEPGHIMYDDILAKSSPDPPSVTIDPEQDTALMLYTGGTTGVPKGAELSHTNINYNCVALYEWARFVHEEGKPPEKMYSNGYHTMIGILPWYHSFGLSNVLLLACMGAGKLICIPDPRAGNPPFTEVLKAVQEYRPTFMAGVPTIFVAFANHPFINKYDLSSFMGCFSGGAPLPPEVCRQFEEKTGSVIFEGWGLTETAPTLSVNPTYKETRKLGSIGFPLLDTDIKIMDIVDPTKEMPQGEDGELAACGPQVMKGYWKRPDANEEVFVQINGNRYFLTGDIGNIDENGYITITDRKKDMIIVSGFNVYPREIEDILYTHPAVELAAVVGILDEKSGEKVKAFIQLKKGENTTIQEINDFCKENMTGYKRPKMIEFRDEIPVSNVGKVLRRVLRDEENKK